MIPNNIPTDAWGEGLLRIFANETDLMGSDLLAMSDFFQIFIDQIETGLQNGDDWQVSMNIESMIGEIASAIQYGYHFANMGTLVADSSHFGQEIVDGLKTGIYHVGQSREVSGNLRPAIVDGNGRLVKSFTLKEAEDPTSVFGDISAMAMQVSLQILSLQIDEIGADIRNLTDMNRRETMSNRFICARDKILRAAAAGESDREKYLDEADSYLLEGLTSLYSDVNAQVQQLAAKRKPFSGVKKIDSVLNSINEDMRMIPRYVGMRVYLMSYRGKMADANRILSEYQYQLKMMSEKKVAHSKYTAFELIHENYPYSGENVDFWLEAPKEMISGIERYEKLLEQKGGNIYYITTEENEDEKESQRGESV